MDIISFLPSISKIAIGAFVVTLIIVAAEVFILVRRHNEEKKPEETVQVPDFTENPNAGANFTKIAQGPFEIQPDGSRKISKSFLGIVLILLLLIVSVGGIFLYIRNRVAPEDVDVVTDVTPDDILPGEPGAGGSSGPVPTVVDNTADGSDAQISSAPSDSTDGGDAIVLPTISVAAGTDTIEEKGGVGTSETDIIADIGSDTATSTSSSTSTTSPTTTGSSSTGTSTTTETTTASDTTSTNASTSDTTTADSDSVSSSAAATATSVPVELPQSGKYQMTLLISVMALTVIYLALIL